MKRVALFVALSTALLATSCSSKKQEKEEEKDYPVTNPLRMDTILNKDYVSQIKSVRNIEIRAQEKGFLEKIYVDEGQYVQAGQLLFRIMPQMYQAEYLKAKAEVKEMQIELQNSKTLADNNVVSKNEQAIAQAHLEKSKAEMQLAQLHLSFTDIRAPFSGVIDRLPMKLGSLIDEGMLLTNLSDNSQMFAYFNVSEPEYLDYQTNIQD
ncbi:MAG: efflux RND transporter periplasmic adaptor subunit, partial [Algoriella sp.]